jgi:hypothetical protein
LKELASTKTGSGSDPTGKWLQFFGSLAGSLLSSALSDSSGEGGGSGGSGGGSGDGLTESVSSSISYGGGDGGGYAEGTRVPLGMVSGPGTSKSDSIPARLSHGEFVVNAEATSKNLSFLQAINNGYKEGGLVQYLSPLFNSIKTFAEGGLVQYAPVVENIKAFANGGLVGNFNLPAFADGGMVSSPDILQSIALPALTPSQQSDNPNYRPVSPAQEAASAVKRKDQMLVQMHPDMLNMTMQDFVNRELARQYTGR